MRERPPTTGPASSTSCRGRRRVSSWAAASPARPPPRTSTGGRDRGWVRCRVAQGSMDMQRMVADWPGRTPHTRGGNRLIGRCGRTPTRDPARSVSGTVKCPPARRRQAGLPYGCSWFLTMSTGTVGQVGDFAAHAPHEAVGAPGGARADEDQVRLFLAGDREDLFGRVTAAQDRPCNGDARLFQCGTIEVEDPLGLAVHGESSGRSPSAASRSVESSGSPSISSIRERPSSFSTYTRIRSWLQGTCRIP